MDETSIIYRGFVFLIGIPVGVLLFLFQIMCWNWVKIIWKIESLILKILYLPTPFGCTFVLPFMIYEGGQKKGHPEIFLSYLIGVIIWLLYRTSSDYKKL